MTCKTVLITGGSGDIGGAIAEKFFKNGYNVALQYFNGEEKANNLISQLKIKYPQATAKLAAFKCDISKASEVSRLFRDIKSELGEIDILINNAGIGTQILFSDITEDIWRNTFGVNVDGCFFCCKEALPHMIHEKQGKILNISSIWGITGASCEVHYSATKAAVIGFTKALAKELGPSNINVNCVAPGVIDTKMNAHLSKEDMDALIDETPLSRLGTPDDVANAVYFLCSDEASFITGQVLGTNGGFVI